VAAVSSLPSISPQALVRPCKERSIVKARGLVCYWAVSELGLSMTAVAGKLDMSVPAVSGAVKKGRQIVSSEGLVLADLLNIEI
jgi:hypothetical protein